MSDSDKGELIVAVSGVVIAVSFLYILIAIMVASVQITERAEWCEWENGTSWGEDAKETGKRFENNPFTLGLTGKCINPGDKGL